MIQPMDNRAFLRRSFEPGLRQTAANRRVMAGVDLVSVKETLGHRDIQTTFRYATLHQDTFRVSSTEEVSLEARPKP